MPNTASAKKALRQGVKLAEKNARTKEQIHYAVKMVRKSAADGKKEEAQKWMLTMQKAIDKAAKKGLIKKNTASRRKSRLANLINKMS
jgi:small subunit ribosomal protein S20